MATAELKPCPCCGHGNPQLTDTSTAQLLEPSIAVLSLVRCIASDGGCGLQSGWYDTDEEAVEAWNRRHQDQQAIDNALERAASTERRVTELLAKQPR